MLVESGLYRVWNLTCLQPSISPCHGSSSPVSLLCHCCTGRDVTSLLLPRLPLTNQKAKLNRDGWCQCFTAKFHLSVVLGPGWSLAYVPVMGAAGLVMGGKNAVIVPPSLTKRLDSAGSCFFLCEYSHLFAAEKNETKWDICLPIKALRAVVACLGEAFCSI